MTSADLTNPPFAPRGQWLARSNTTDRAAPTQRIPGSFQFVLGLYVVLTGTFPTIAQSLAFGVTGGAGSEFASAMATGMIYDLLLLLPVLLIASHPLGILHPLLVAVLVWPLLTHIPGVIDDWGGWAGVLSGMPVDAPQFQGLPGRSASTVWTAISKANLVRILALACTYIGFFTLRGKPNLARVKHYMPSASSMRTIMVALISVSIFTLLVFLRQRGGINEHLTSLGGGRFKELSNYGIALVIIQLGGTSLYLWAAASPSEVKSPFFLAAMVAVMAAAFISNGSRGGALEVPLMVGIIWGIRSRRVPWKTALVLLPFMFMAVGFLGAIRTSSWSGSTAADTVKTSSFTQSLARTQKEIEARNAAAADVPVVERGYEVSHGPLLGVSYAAMVTSFIPRPLWPSKPRGVGQMYARLFLGAAFIGTSIPVNPEFEMYWNFGLAGVILLSIIYGALVRLAYQIYWKWYPNPFATVLYLLFLTSFQFSSDRVVALEQRGVLVIICYFVMAIFGPRPDHMAERTKSELALLRRQASIPQS